MNLEWKPLDQDRVICFATEHLVLIKPNNLGEQEVCVPLFCPVCLFPMKSSEDIISWKLEESCYICRIYWKERWKNQLAVKPTKEDWEEFMTLRRGRAKNSVIKLV